MKNSATYFQAPWGRTLRVVSALVALVLAGISVAGLVANLPMAARWLMCGLPLAILAACALFAVRGYIVGADALSIRRPFWSTRVPLAGLLSAAPEAGAMSNSFRLFGNGGAFGFTGWFRNRKLGTYRAFVTDLNRCVVLRFPNRTIVVSPARPQEFVKALKRSLPAGRA